MLGGDCAMCDMCVKVVGYITLGLVLLRFLKLVTQLVRPRQDLSKYGQWAVVTGATDGIGKAIAFELGKHKQNLLIIGRNPTKLNDTSKELQGRYPEIRVEQFQLDLSEFDVDAQERYRAAIETKNVGILVNNAGLSYKYVTYYDEIDMGTVDNLINVNNHSPAILCHITLQRMLKKDSKRKGIIVNMSSAGSIVPHELHCLYGATKAFLNKFTTDLALEYTKKGIMFQVQLPYFVVSKMSRIRKPSLTTPTPQSYAYHSVSQMGYAGLLSPHPVHAIIFFVLSFVPQFLLERFIGNMHHVIRKKALKKYAVKKE